jgi:predicted transcriptional regulator
MARKRSATLTDGEARLMNVLWRRGRATVTEVLHALPSKPPISYSTVQTILRILESKGYIAHEKAGRAFVYRPIVERRTARRRALRHLVSRLFDGSPALLVLNVLEDDQLDVEELKRLKQLIERAEEP